MKADEWREQVRSLISRAVRAPSSHNTQPWLFRAADSTIDLLADRSRALPVNDPDDRELTISCGCALTNLRIAAADGGFDVEVQLLPELEQSDVLARVSFSAPSNAVTEQAQIADCIERRRTYRQPFSPRAVDGSVLDQLIAATKREGAHLQPLMTQQSRQQAVTLVAEGDRAQWDNPRWRRELATWIRPRRRGDGLTAPTVGTPVARGIVRAFDMGDWVAQKDQKLAEASSLLVALTTDGDGPDDWLLAGQALQRLLLVACQYGLQATYLNQPVQVAPLRPLLQNLVGAGVPQVLFGFGYPEYEITATPRRPVEEVIG